jgi:hypothetical protein
MEAKTNNSNKGTSPLKRKRKVSPLHKKIATLIQNIVTAVILSSFKGAL